jgi:hypothetical protein
MTGRAVAATKSRNGGATASVRIIRIAGGSAGVACGRDSPVALRPRLSAGLLCAAIDGIERAR